MHYLVRFIVEADYAHQATSKVIDTLDNLVEMHEFDWYHDTAERSRWKNCWKPGRSIRIRFTCPASTWIASW